MPIVELLEVCLGEAALEQSCLEKELGRMTCEEVHRYGCQLGRTARTIKFEALHHFLGVHSKVAAIEEIRDGK
jgi:hypothetical protein